MCKHPAILVGALVALATPSLAVVGPTSGGGDLAAHVVMVLKRAGNTPGFCSGVVVANGVVLTAAHCVAAAADTRVHFRDESGKPVLLPVAATAVHPEYRADAVRLRQRSIDLALVRLSMPLPRRFAPTALATKGTIAVGQRVQIAGFGITHEVASDTGGTLRVAILAARAPLSSIVLWAEDPTGQGAGACKGDSGAPIFGEDGQTLIAVTSWAAGSGKRHCGELTQAALIGPQRDWIDGVLRQWQVR